MPMDFEKYAKFKRDPEGFLDWIASKTHDGLQLTARPRQT